MKNYDLFENLLSYLMNKLNEELQYKNCEIYSMIIKIIN